MDKRSTYYPYMENIKLIRSFFSSPLVLVCAIFAGISALAEIPFTLCGIDSLFKLYDSNVEINPFSIVLRSVNLLALAECIGLLLLYIKSRSRKFSTLKAPLTFLRVISLVLAIMSAISAAILACIWAAVGFFWVYIKLFSLPINDSPMFFGLFLIICCVVVLCKSIFQFVWLDSVKKSVNSVYLCRYGSVMCAVFSIISAVLLLVSELTLAYDLQLSVATTAAIVFYILLAITTMRYNSYIKKHAYAASLEPRAAHNVEKVPVIEPSQSAADMDVKSETPQIEPSLYEKLSDFTPQNVDFSAMSSDNDEQKDEPSDKQSDEHIICPACKTQCEATDKFCPRCGAALNNKS